MAYTPQTITPDWNNAPEWANFVAMDYDQVWWWHEYEPVRTFYEWEVESTGRAAPVFGNEMDWMDSLQERPKNQ